MAYIAFIAGVVLTGFVASFIPVDTMNTRKDQPDYHFVPYAGDAFGA